MMMMMMMEKDAKYILKNGVRHGGEKERESIMEAVEGMRACVCV